MEPTADNYQVRAEEDDGTCIPARDKLVGSFTYTRVWTDVITANDTVDFGTIQFTEKNTANNHFLSNFNGSIFLSGAVTADDLVYNTYATEFYQYTGTGTWLRSDSVNLVLNISYLNYAAGVPQPYTYYCTKLPD